MRGAGSKNDPVTRAPYSAPSPERVRKSPERPANVSELERMLKFDENVLRSMILKLSDAVNVDARRIELQQQAEAAAQRAAEAARERAESDSMGARRGHSKDDE